MNQSIRPNINSLWDYSNPQATRTKFEKLLQDQRELAPLDYTLQIKTQIARTYSLSAEFDKAHQTLDEVKSLLNQNTPVAKVRYLLERGRAFNSYNQKSKATEIFIEAYTYGKKIDAHSYAVDAAHMIALSSSTLSEKQEWNEKGLKQAKISTDPKVRSWIGVFHNNMGWDLFDDKQYEEALKSFEMCRDFYTQTSAKNRLKIAKWSIAKTYRYLARINEALSIQQALLEQSNGVDESGYTYEELAELHLIKGNKDLAKSYFLKAFEILSKDPWLQKNESKRLARLKDLSD